MTAKGKIIKIGFDLDGVIIDKPPFVPKRLIEWLYRGRINKKLVYRYPGKIEKYIRWASHYYLFRPPIKKNLKILKRLSKNKNVELYAISGRYSFLRDRTHQWFKRNEVKAVFEKIYLNEKDEQPHRFKKNILNNLKLDFFIDDDPLIIKYLKREVRNTRILDEKRTESELSRLLKVKILIGISYYLPNISGLTIYAQNLAEELVKKGHEVNTLTSQHLKKLPFMEKEKGVLIKRIWTPFILGRGPIMPTYFYEAYKAVKKVDVVNIHIPQFEGFMLAFWAKLLRKKIVLTHHCDLSNWPGLVNQITEKVTYLSLGVTAHLADTIIVYTKDYADHSKYLSRFKNKLVYQLPPVKVEKPTGKLRKKYKHINYKIGFAGRITREKGIECLLNTIPVLEKELSMNFKIFLAGPYKDVIGGGDLRTIDKLFKKYKRYLVLLGSLDAKKMADFYQTLDVLVLPSTEKIESFGFVQVEAMLLGCPVIASDLPGVRMPIKLDGMGKTVPAKNCEVLAETIIEVLRNKKKYVKSKKEIEKTFSHQNNINFYEKLFENIS